MADVITLPVIRIERLNPGENHMARNGHDDGTEQVTADETRKMIPGKKLKELLATMRKGKSAQTRIAGEVGSEIKTAIERYGCNRKVLRLLHQLDGMENEDIADFLDELKYYLDVSGIEKRAESAPRFSEMSTSADEHADA
jgi:hypothetical protein